MNCTMPKSEMGVSFSASVIYDGRSQLDLTLFTLAKIRRSMTNLRSISFRVRLLSPSNREMCNREELVELLHLGNRLGISFSSPLLI